MSCNSASVFRVCTEDYDSVCNTYYMCETDAKQMDVSRFNEITFTRLEPKKKLRAKLLCFYADDEAAGVAGLKKGDLWCDFKSGVHTKL